MTESILAQFDSQLFQNSSRVMSDLYEYHDYIAYGVVQEGKITGFCHIVWDIEFSSVYLPLSHIIIGIADSEYRHNRDLESDVPTVKYGVDLRCRGGKIENTTILPNTQSVLLLQYDTDNRLTFIGEHTFGTPDGFGAEISYTDGKYSILYGVWQNGTLKYQYKDKNWVEVK